MPVTRKLALSSHRDLLGRLSEAVLIVVCLSIGAGCSGFAPMIGHTTARQQRKLDEARDLMQEEKYEKAEVIARDLLRQAPNNIDGRKFLVAVYLEEGRIDDAIHEMRRILQLNPEETETLTELAMLLIERRRYSEAESVIDQALSVESNNIPLLRMQGELRERRGADRDALSSYYRILSSYPDDEASMLRIASIEMRRNKPEQAIPLLRQITTNTSASAESQKEAQKLLADACGERQRWGEVVAALTELSQQEKLSSDLMYKLAYSQFRAGETHAAKNTLARFLAESPKDPRGVALADQFAPQLLDPLQQPTRVAIIPVGHSLQ